MSLFNVSIVDSSGEHLRTLSVSDPLDLGINVGPGEYALLDPPPSAPCWWDFDACVWNIKPPSPGASFFWDPKSKEWRDRRTFKDMQDELWATLKAARSAAEQAPFEWDGGLYRADAVRINGAVTSALVCRAMGIPYTEEWTLEDNSRRILTADDVIQLGIALGAHISSAHRTGRALRDAVYSATCHDQLDDIKWPVKRSSINQK